MKLLTGPSRTHTASVTTVSALTGRMTRVTLGVRSVQPCSGSRTVSDRLTWAAR
jgi:NADPH-dependent ferric siderophore reductase